MEKEIGSIKFTETDSGYRIDINGKDLKNLMPCCLPLAGCDDTKDATCCVKVVKAEKGSGCC